MIPILLREEAGHSNLLGCSLATHFWKLSYVGISLLGQEVTDMTTCSHNKAAIASNLTQLYYIDCPQGNLLSHVLGGQRNLKKIKNPTSFAEYGFRVRFVIPIKSKRCSPVRYYLRKTGPLETGLKVLKVSDQVPDHSLGSIVNRGKKNPQCLCKFLPDYLLPKPQSKL